MGTVGKCLPFSCPDAPMFYAPKMGMNFRVPRKRLGGARREPETGSLGAAAPESCSGSSRMSCQLEVRERVSKHLLLSVSRPSV